MTLLETIKMMENIARSQPTINMIVKNDIFRLNGSPTTKYGVFAYTQGQHSSSTYEDWQEFSFTLFYVDRLTENQSNELDVQSTGIQTLGNILNGMQEAGVDVGSYTIQPFSQKFEDYCAGVYASVKLIVSKTSICEQGFGDFNNDFNDDFLIY